jgi:LAO/AO transport system kinase
MKAELEHNVHLRPPGGWRPPVVMTQAIADQGIDAVIAAIGKHREWLRESRDGVREADRRTHEFIEVLTSELEERAERALRAGTVPEILARVKAGELNPYSAARSMIDDPDSIRDLLRNGGPK